MIYSSDVQGMGADQRRTVLEARDYFRATFSDNDGRWVLKYLLRMLGYWNKGEDEGDMTLRNVAIEILDLMGVTHEENIDYLVDAHINAPVVVEPPGAKESNY